MLVAAMIQVFVNSVIYDYWGMASFGQRRMCSSTVPVIVGLAIVLRSLHLVVRRLSVRWKHGIAIAVLGYFLVWNMNWVGQLRHAKSAGRGPAPLCCGDVPGPLAWLARPIHRAIGNPFAFPASALYSWKHDVDLARWDKIVGDYPLQPPPLGYNDGSYRKVTTNWWPSDDFLIEGWAKGQAAGGKKWRWTTQRSARFLIPILLPEPHQITAPVAANVGPGQTAEVVVRVDGDEVARAQVGPAWTTITFLTPGDSVGEREITFEAAPVPYQIGAEPGAVAGTVPVPPVKPAGVPVGVAVGPLHLALPPLGT
jgi:hypothetical protein